MLSACGLALDFVGVLALVGILLPHAQPLSMNDQAADQAARNRAAAFIGVPLLVIGFVLQSLTATLRSRGICYPDNEEEPHPFATVATAIVRLLCGLAPRRTVGENGCRKIEEKISPRAVASRTIAVYATALGGTDGRRRPRASRQLPVEFADPGDRAPGRHGRRLGTRLDRECPDDWVTVRRHRDVSRRDRSSTGRRQLLQLEADESRARSTTSPTTTGSCRSARSSTAWSERGLSADLFAYPNGRRADSPRERKRCCVNSDTGAPLPQSRG